MKGPVTKPDLVDGAFPFGGRSNVFSVPVFHTGFLKGGFVSVNAIKVEIVKMVPNIGKNLGLYLSARV